MVALLVGWFASKEAIAATELPTSIVDAMVAAGIDRRAAVVAGEMSTIKRLTGRSRHGSPTPYDGMPVARKVASEEPEMRARFVWNSATRLTEAPDWDKALSNERRYLEEHIQAGRNRRACARKLDDLGERHQWLVWRTHMDERTDGTCAALNGRIFRADNPPAIPGAVHPRCRCHAEPWDGIKPNA